MGLRSWMLIHLCGAPAVVGIALDLGDPVLMPGLCTQGEEGERQ